MNFWFFTIAMRLLYKGYDIADKTPSQFFSLMSMTSGMNYMTFFIPSFLSFNLKKHFTLTNEAISFAIEWYLFLVAIIWSICGFVRLFKDNKLDKKEVK